MANRNDRPGLGRSREWQAAIVGLPVLRSLRDSTAGLRSRRLLATLAATVLMTGTAGAALQPALADSNTSRSATAHEAAGPDAGQSRYIILSDAPGQSGAAEAGKHHGKVKEDLPLVHGSVVDLSPSDAADAAADAGVTVVPDDAISLQGSSFSPIAAAGSPCTAPCNVFPQLTGVPSLQASQGDNGQGATVAVLDTGIDQLPDFAGRLVGGIDLTGGNNPFQDDYGHGTFVAGLIAGNGVSSGGAYVGEAPGANLVSIKVAGASGATDMATVIGGIAWAIANQPTLGIQVLNLSLGALPTGPTAVEPLDRAVEQAWRSGITVVVSAGNAGPFNGTILSPGDDPMIITAGSLDDAHSTASADWAVSDFSSVGPTEYDGWLKPDLVAPGAHVVSLRAPGSTIDTTYGSTGEVGTANFVGSGTSFSAAITSGAAALLLSAKPDLGPNQVKARLLLGATPGPEGSPFVDGHGVLNAYNAVTAPSGNLNQGPARTAETSNLGQLVSLPASWMVSSFNGGNWINVNGSAWNGSAWNGSAWNGSAWNGSAWNGSAWNGSAWN